MFRLWKTFFLSPRNLRFCLIYSESQYLCRKLRNKKLIELVWHVNMNSLRCKVRRQSVQTIEMDFFPILNIPVILSWKCNCLRRPSVWCLKREKYDVRTYKVSWWKSLLWNLFSHWVDRMLKLIRTRNSLKKCLSSSWFPTVLTCFSFLPYQLPYEFLFGTLTVYQRV